MLLSMVCRGFSTKITNIVFRNNKIKHNNYNQIKPDFMTKPEKPVVELPEIMDVDISNNTSQNTSTITSTNPVIKHIVMAGGGAMGFAFYGALKESHQQGKWKQEDIKTIYATSIGTIMGTIISLGYDWSVIDNFLIKRPWQQVFKFQLPMAFNLITKQGIFDQTTIYEIFLPLFKGKDIPMDICLLDFYHLTKRDIHFIATEINTMQIEDISYKTHPEWKVIDAIYASCCLPFLFSPFYYYTTGSLEPQKAFMDGGILMNFPLNLCIAEGYDPREILSIRRIKNNTTTEPLQPNNTMIELSLSLVLKLIEKIEKPPVQLQEIGYLVNIETSVYNLYTYLFNCIHYEETRRELINIGVNAVSTERSSTERSSTERSSTERS